MKKLIITSLLLVSLLITAVVSFQAGVQHAITDSELWGMDIGYDPEIDIYLDGQWYIHNSYTN